LSSKKVHYGRILIISFIFFFLFSWIGPIVVGAQEPDEPEVEEETIESSEQREELFWGEVYGQGVTSQGENYNAVSDIFVKQGIHAFKLWGQPLDVYLKGRFLYDRDRYYWNNRYEFGIGSRYKPFSQLGLFVFLDLLYGDYTGRDRGDEPNPNDSAYFDIQTGLTFWQWWGRKPWQVKSLEIYAPFTGWRELYGDAIYYHHFDNNFIVTFDYKEGFMLWRLGPMLFDSYIAVEGSCDTNRDEWYNYAAVGPGLRVKPFHKIDLQASVEYLWGSSYLGGFGDTDKKISDLVLTLAFWYGW